MDSSLSSRDFIIQIGADLGKSEAQMSKFIKMQGELTGIRLEDEWIQTAQQLQKMSEKQLETLGLPMALRIAILQKFQKTDKQQPPLQTEKKPSPPPKPVAPSAVENPIDEEMQELLIIDDKVKGKIKDFTMSAGVETASKSLKTISKIVGNILKEPKDMKKRELKYENAVIKRDITPYKEAGDILIMVSFLQKQAGFKTTDLTFRMVKMKQKLLDRIYVLTLSASEQLATQIPKYEFDPYKPHLISQNPSHVVKGEMTKFEPGHMQEKIEEQLAIQEKETKSAKIDRNPYIIDTSKLKSKSAMEQKFKVMDLEEEEKMSELKQLKLEIMKIGKKDEKFVSKREKELEKLKQTKVFTHSLIRIQMPDSLILQGTFSPYDRVSKIVSFVKEYCPQKERAFILFKAPPYQPLNLKDNPTLKECKLVPTGVLRFRWADLEMTTEKDGPFLDVSCIVPERYLIWEE